MNVGEGQLGRQPNVAGAERGRGTVGGEEDKEITRQVHWNLLSMMGRYWRVLNRGTIIEFKLVKNRNKNKTPLADIAVHTLDIRLYKA